MPSSEAQGGFSGAQRGPAPGAYFGFLAFGRLRPGMALQQARAELETINRNLETAWPATNRGVYLVVQNRSQLFIGPDAFVIYGSLWAAVWFVLLISCANVANLSLAQISHLELSLGSERCGF